MIKETIWSKVKRILIKVINWTWCLPQNLVALIVLLFVKVHDKRYLYKATVYHTDLICGSVSLGNHIFLCMSHWNKEDVLKHEYGHCVQSYILGPLYLLVIGLPSLIWAGCFDNFRTKHGISYYWFYTEKWANKIAGLDK